MFGTNRHSRVGIEGQQFTINGQPTLAGREYDGHSLEGLLFNARMVQALFDDEHPSTRPIFAYPDTGTFDPDRNVTECCRAMPSWQGDRRQSRLQAITVNFQGGRPVRAAPDQPWRVSGFTADGSLKPAWLERLHRLLTRADTLGLVVILGYFYFGQEDVFRDDEAVRTAATNLTDWLLTNEFTNVLVEVTNECNVNYDRRPFQPEHIDELIRTIQARSRAGWHYDVGVSFGGGTVPTSQVIEASDYVLMHGNGVEHPDRIREMVEETRADPAYDDEPIVFNEDDHYEFDAADNNMEAAISRYASWGYFDPGTNDYASGFQCPPVDWRIRTDRERAFFRQLHRIVHGETPPHTA